MHFTILNAFTAAVVIALSEQAAAAPVPQSGIISLPLRRVRHPARDSLDPVMLFQLHHDNSEKRFAKMSGRAIPSDNELKEKRELLVKRFNHYGVDTPSTPEKRFSRVGVTDSDRSNEGAVELTAQSFAEDGNDDDMTPEIHVDFIQDCGDDNPGAAPPKPDTPGPSSSQGAPGASPTPDTPESSGNGTQLKMQIIGNDVGYFSVVQMGTPPREFKILMDSGSADLWVGSEDCKAQSGGGGCGPHVFLGSQSSSSFKGTQDPFQVKYGTGFVSGFKATDNLKIGDMVLENHAFGVANVESPEFAGNNIQFDGLMGLAIGSLSNQKTITPVEALAKEGKIKEAITSYKISRRADGKDDGSIDFGGLDSSKFDAGTLVEIDNVSKVGFWEAPIEAMAVGGQDLGLTGRTAILDTGTTLILAPTEDAIKIHAAIPNSQRDGDSFIIPCDHKSEVKLTFGGRQFTIDPRDLAFANMGDNKCKSGINAGSFGSSQTQYLIGDVFLKNAYYSTNVNKNKLSLANLV